MEGRVYGQGVIVVLTHIISRCHMDYISQKSLFIDGKNLITNKQFWFQKNLYDHQLVFRISCCILNENLLGVRIAQ